MEQLAEAARLAKQVEPEIVKSAALAPAIAMLLSVMDAPAPFDNVTDCDALPEPTEVSGKERPVGETDALLEAANPVPVNATLCGLLAAESVNLRVAARVPSPVGLNTIVAEQFAEAARPAPQVVAATANSAAFVPVMVMPLIDSDVLSPLASTTDCDPLLDPTAVPANERLEGLTATLLGAVPRPVRVTVCGLPASESLKFSVAVRVPVAVGPNTIFTVQLVPAASVEPQVLLNTVKSAGLAPLKAMLLMVIAVVFPFVSVATFCPPLFPIATEAHDMPAGDTDAAAKQQVPGSTLERIASRQNMPGARTWRDAFDNLRTPRRLARPRLATRFNAEKMCILAPGGLQNLKTNKSSNGLQCPQWRASFRYRKDCSFEIAGSCREPGRKL